MIIKQSENGHRIIITVWPAIRILSVAVLTSTSVSTALLNADQQLISEKEIENESTISYHIVSGRRLFYTTC